MDGTGLGLSLCLFFCAKDNFINEWAFGKESAEKAFNKV